MAKKKEVKVTPKLSDLIGAKLIDVSRDKEKTMLHFSNNFDIVLKGYGAIKVKEEEQND